MAIVTNIDVKQKLPTSSNANKPNVSSNHPNFGEGLTLALMVLLLKLFQTIHIPL
jgi:hypothetical protein